MKLLRAKAGEWLTQAEGVPMPSGRVFAKLAIEPNEKRPRWQTWTDEQKKEYQTKK